MMKAHAKKILILGGTKHMIHAVEAVKRMGMSPVVADNVMGSPAKSYADQAFNLSTADIAGLVKLIQQEKLDGILTAFEAINTWTAIALCKKTNLPFYSTADSLAIAPNKEKFSEICQRFDVRVIEEKPFTKERESVAIASWEFPVIAKPAEAKRQKAAAGKRRRTGRTGHSAEY